jgi:type IV pilus assembly protein PilW
MKNRATKSLVSAPRARGFTLVELMVTVAIALFLIGGLLTIIQNVRVRYADQQALAQLQDQQRFAMGVITDIVQQAGYFPDPVVNTVGTALTAVGPFQAGQAFFGAHVAGNPDTLSVRFRINQITGTGVVDGILCDGSTNWTVGPDNLYTNTFSVLPPAGNAPGQLQCSVNGAPARTIVNGIENLQVLYGVKRTATSDYNVDTYLDASQMLPNGSGGPNGGDDWQNISAVRVRITFTNPMANTPGQQPTILFDRVIEVMGRAGVHT